MCVFVCTFVSVGVHMLQCTYGHACTYYIHTDIISLCLLLCLTHSLTTVCHGTWLVEHLKILLSHLAGISSQQPLYYMCTTASSLTWILRI